MIKNIKKLITNSIISLIVILTILSCQKITKTPPKQEESLLGIKKIEINDNIYATIFSYEDDSLKLHNAKFEQVAQLSLKKGDVFTISDHHHWHDSYRVLVIKKDGITLAHTHNFTGHEESYESNEIIFVIPYPTTNDTPVDFKLADMVEDVIRETNFKINISNTAKKSINIDKIDGLNVCDIKAKQKVLKLQKSFNSHANIYRNNSAYGMWIKRINGKFNHTFFRSKKMNGCKNVYISIR